MGIPTSYNKLTVRQFLGCVEICKKGLKDYDENIELVAYLLNKPVEEIESMTYEQTIKLTNRASRLKASKPSTRVRKYLFVKGRIYKAVTDVKHFSAQRFLHYETNPELHKRASALYIPIFSKLTFNGSYKDSAVHQWDALAEAFLDLKVSQISGVVFFYLRKWKRLSPIMEAYMKLSQMTISRRMSEILAPEANGRTSQSITDGTGTSM